MNKEVFKSSFIELLDKNFDKRASYFDLSKFKIFFEFSTLIFEINKSIISEHYRAAITLTNHFLERLLKITLIYNEVGVGPLAVENWDEKFGIANDKYDNLKLGNSIERCKKFELINDSEKEYLWEIIRECMRNGFSHAESPKILADLPNRKTFFYGKLNNPTALKPIIMNQKKIPTFQAILIEKFAEANAEKYFDFIYNLSLNIEDRLIEKSKKS